MDYKPFEDPARPPPNDPEWRDMLRNWETEFFAGFEENGPPDLVRACRIPIQDSVRSTLAWCLAQGESLWSTREKLSDTAYLVRDLYEALTEPENASPKLKNRTTFWRHMRLDWLLPKASAGELAREIDVNAVKAVANNYIACPWMQNAYLDWVFIEALMLGENLAFSDHLLKLRFGLSYALYGTSWKARAFRLAAKPLSFALGWLAPGALLLWLGTAYPLAALTMAVLYYGWSLFLLVRFVVNRVRYRLREGASPARKLAELARLMHIAYEQMAEEIVHVPSLQAAIAAAREKGASWPSQLYVILDLVVSRSPSSWNRAPGWKAG